MGETLQLIGAATTLSLSALALIYPAFRPVGGKGPPKTEHLLHTPREDLEHEEPEAGHPEPGPKASRYLGEKIPPIPPEGWVQMTSADGLRITRPSRSWASPLTAQALLSAATHLQARAEEMGVEGTTVEVWDISKEGGGKLGSHLSHRQGRDVDARIVGLDDPDQKALALTTFLEGLIARPDLDSIFMDWDDQAVIWRLADRNPHLWTGIKPELQYPLPKHKGRTRIRHWDGHKNHIHVRFLA